MGAQLSPAASHSQRRSALRSRLASHRPPGAKSANRACVAQRQGGTHHALPVLLLGLGMAGHRGKGLGNRAIAEVRRCLCDQLTRVRPLGSDLAPATESPRCACLPQPLSSLAEQHPPARHSRCPVAPGSQRSASAAGKQLCRNPLHQRLALAPGIELRRKRGKRSSQGAPAPPAERMARASTRLGTSGRCLGPAADRPACLRAPPLVHARPQGPARVPLGGRSLPPRAKGTGLS